MPTANDITALKARVQALGFRLVTCDGLREHGRDGNPEYTGLYILNPETDELEVISAGSAKDDLDEITGWCETEEEGRRRARAVLDAKKRPTSEATRRDDDSPEEQFLDLVVLCGLKDRLDAMQIRKDMGTEAAIKFLKETTLTAEHEDGANDDKRALPAVTVLDGDMRDTIYGLSGIARALDRHGSDHETMLLASGLVTLARALEKSLGTLPSDVADALDALDPVARVYP